MKKKSYHFIDDIVSRSIGQFSTDIKNKPSLTIEPSPSINFVNRYFTQNDKNSMENLDELSLGFESNFDKEKFSYHGNSMNGDLISPEDNKVSSKTNHSKNLTGEVFSTKQDASADIYKTVESDNSFRNESDHSSIRIDVPTQTRSEKFSNGDKLEPVDASSASFSPYKGIIPQGPAFNKKSNDNVSAKNKSHSSKGNSVNKTDTNDYNTSTSKLGHIEKPGSISLSNSNMKLTKSRNELESAANRKIDTMSLTPRFDKTKNVTINIDRIEIINSNQPIRSTINTKSKSEVTKKMSLQEYMNKRIQGEF